MFAEQPNIPAYVDFPAHFPLLLRHALYGGGIDCGEGWRGLLFGLFGRLEALAAAGVASGEFACAAKPWVGDDEQGSDSRLLWLYHQPDWVAVPYTVQVKQKFASLRISLHAATAPMLALIEAAAAQAVATCDLCGVPGSPLRHGHGMAVRCPTHQS